jgi:dipeptidyl aminopeptidase/acylaminoacyl peptidase
MRSRKNVLTKMSTPFKIIIVGCLILLSGSLRAALSQSKDDFPIPETYKTEGIPAIKNSEVENLFYDPASIRSNLIWDTDRKNRRMLVTDETNNVYLLDKPLSQPVKLFEKIVPQFVKMRPNGESFAYNSDYEDEDNYQLYLYDFKEKTSKKLISLTGKDESIDSFIWSKTGDSLFYMRVDYDAKVSHLCRYDFVSEKCFPIDLKGVWSVIQDGGNKILIKDFKGSTNQFIYVYDLQTNKLTPIDEKGNSPKSFLVGESVFWVSEGNENCKNDPCILSLNLKNNKLTQLKLTEDITNLYEVKFSPEGSNLMIQETRDGIDYLRVFRIKKDKIVKQIPQFISGSYVIWNTRWMSDREIVYTLENVGKPASIQSYNIETQQFTNWTKERLPSKLENKVKPPEVFKWSSFDQKNISGFIIRPIKTEKKSPVMIFVHGGPPVLDRPVFNSQDIRLASSFGMTIIHTNIRGSSGFTKEFMDADNKEKRSDAVKDIQALLDWIEKQPDLDSKQIFLRGESYGGFVVLSTALQEPSRIKAVIAEYPLISIRGFLSQSWIDEVAKNEYGDPKDENLMTRLDELSPLNNANRWNKIPLFLTRGKLDARIPEKDVTDLKNQLQNNGTEVWYIFSTEDGHGFGGKYVFAAMYEFLKKQIN